jgi:hypothetical protein
MFFSEEKNQKTFDHSGLAFPDRPGPARAGAVIQNL